ncbi:MAG: hypothetical protein KJO30_02720 [Boseongicola sp.]|nr:hypothetical protein [Boseongicola sp.]NNJ69466.1 hypothetical protein [Boseongicola sp.]
MSEYDDFPPWHIGLARFAVKLAVVATLVFATLSLLDWAQARAQVIGSDSLMFGVLAGLLLVYVLLLAVPFVPGIEIGLSLLLMKGADIAPVVYVATVLGLSLAFTVGHIVPYRWLHATMADLRLKRACALIERLEPMTHEQRLDHLTNRLPKAIAPYVRKGRYLIFAVMFSMPGNAVVGGGGGIAFIAGFSRLFRPWAAYLTILLAVLPVPLLVWLFGEGVIALR